MTGARDDNKNMRDGSWKGETASVMRPPLPGGHGGTMNEPVAVTFRGV